MALSLKPGVRFEGMSFKIIKILPKLMQVFATVNQDVIITSARDGLHKKGSKHYIGDAVDVRTNFLTAVEKLEVHAKAQELLGADYDVVLEKDHIHCEYDPK